MIYYQGLAVTTDAAGDGTATTTEPVNGLVYEVRYPGTAFGSTADFTLTRQGAIGGTVLNLTDATGPWQYAPRQNEHTTAGGSIGADALIPSNDYLQLVVAEGGSVTSGTVYVIYQRP